MAGDGRELPVPLERTAGQARNLAVRRRPGVSGMKNGAVTLQSLSMTDPAVLLP